MFNGGLNPPNTHLCVRHWHRSITRLPGGVARSFRCRTVSNATKAPKAQAPRGERRVNA